MKQLRTFQVIPILWGANLGKMTMTDRRSPQDDGYHSEPEIIPPGQTDLREMESKLWGRVVTDRESIHRVYVSKIGPLGLLPFFLLAGVVGAAVLFFMFGAFLILIPVAGVVLAATIVAGLLRPHSRWPR
jgi:hypothetical protein